MSIQITVEVIQRSVPYSEFVESFQNYELPRATLDSVVINPIRSNRVNNETEVIYEFIITTSGSPSSGTFLEIFHRSLFMNTNRSSIGNFFTPWFGDDTIIDSTSSFDVKQRITTDSDYTYDTFYTQVGIGIDEHIGLKYFTLKNPPGLIESNVSVGDVIDTKSILRNIDGLVVYDYFILAAEDA